MEKKRHDNRDRECVRRCHEHAKTCKQLNAQKDEAPLVESPSFDVISDVLHLSSK
jgi:hypothetical protein